MKRTSLILLAILAISCLPACKTERTYYQPIEKREIHAGLKPKDYDSSTFGKPKVRKHRKKY